MSRPLRVEYPGAWYHVMNRGRRREKVFLSDSDYLGFLEILRDTSKMWNLKVSAYCLMPNHYHLLVQTPDGNLARCMRHLNGLYTQRFNRTYETDGSLFRGRYKAVLIDADSYLLDVLRYIHRNPIDAGLAKEMEDFAWSSHKGYLSSAGKWKWLYKDGLISMFSGQKDSRSAYLEFVTGRIPDTVEHFYSLKNLPSILGSDSFKNRIKEQFQKLRFQNEIPESRVLAPSPEAIIKEVIRHFMINRQQLLHSRRGRENLPRNIAIYLVRRHCRATLVEIGRIFDIENYSSVSSSIERVKRRLGQTPSLRNQVKRIEKKVEESQEQT
ncbi:MAG: transposase [Deltaproteobacteria bacterium]|nr:transposase [Deltaproteobacteria bacterium]